ncbi:hypothetical protein M0R45_011599 [Rubus argutus]|uniref:Uncharacterized protein n=1 Tax=Rubus argutus TaxID=59490 RepID=A0AAW1YB97_RUBAR
MRFLTMAFICEALRLQAGHKYCLLGKLSSEVGWNHYDTIRELQKKRKETSQIVYERKKQLNKRGVVIRITEGFSFIPVILDCNYMPMTIAIYENYVYEGVGCIYGDIEETGFAISPALKSGDLFKARAAELKAALEVGPGFRVKMNTTKSMEEPYQQLEDLDVEEVVANIIAFE